MTIRAQIQCINKSVRDNPYERIMHIGGVIPNGNRWKLSQPEAIKRIEDKTYSFYVSQGGRTVDVIVATSAYGNKYLKTTADDVEPNNLLSLPECP